MNSVSGGRGEAREQSRWGTNDINGGTQWKANCLLGRSLPVWIHQNSMEVRLVREIKLESHAGTRIWKRHLIDKEEL